MSAVGIMAAALTAGCVPRLECGTNLTFTGSTRLNPTSTSASVSHCSSKLWRQRTCNGAEHLRRFEYRKHRLRQENAFSLMILRSSPHYAHMPQSLKAHTENNTDEEQEGRRNHLVVVLCMAREMGRVGIYKREGNVSLASFGIKSKKDKHGNKVDLTKSLSQMLPYIVTATAASALIQPASFAWVRKDYYAPALGGIMLSIGIQLSVSDFAIAFKRPLPVLIGYTTQYMVKPALGLLVVTVFNVPAAFAAGLILTSCVAGAQLSSYAAYLSDGDIALGIILTSLTTITSVIVTPLLTRLLIGSVVPVDVVAMASSILQVVIAPIMLGLALNTYAKGFVNKVRQFMPLVAMVCTSLCIGSPLALNRSQIVSIEGFKLLFPVLAFHMSAFILGYWVPRITWWRQDEKVSKTISLCTGMQSSTLAMLLATQFLGGSHAVPPACSVVVMAIMGLSLGSFWGKGNRVQDLGNNIFYTTNKAYT